VDLEEATHQNWPPATAQVRFLPPFVPSAVRLRRSTRNEQRGRRGKFTGKIVRGRDEGWEGGGGRKRAAMAMGAEPGVQIEALSFAVFHFCPRAACVSTVMPPRLRCPNCPRVGRGSLVIKCRICWFYLGFSFLSCITSQRKISSRTDVTGNLNREVYCGWATRCVRPTWQCHTFV
jgi:hypothetical protein